MRCSPSWSSGRTPREPRLQHNRLQPERRRVRRSGAAALSQRADHLRPRSPAPGHRRQLARVPRRPPRAEDWGFAPSYDLNRTFADYLVPNIRKRYGSTTDASHELAMLPPLEPPRDLPPPARSARVWPRQLGASGSWRPRSWSAAAAGAQAPAPEPPAGDAGTTPGQETPGQESAAGAPAAARGRLGPLGRPRHPQPLDSGGPGTEPAPEVADPTAGVGGRTGDLRRAGHAQPLGRERRAALGRVDRHGEPLGGRRHRRTRGGGSALRPALGAGARGARAGLRSYPMAPTIGRISCGSARAPPPSPSAATSTWSPPTWMSQLAVTGCASSPGAWSCSSPRASPIASARGRHRLRKTAFTASPCTPPSWTSSSTRVGAARRIVRVPIGKFNIATTPRSTTSSIDRSRPPRSSPAFWPSLGSASSARSEPRAVTVWCTR